MGVDNGIIEVAPKRQLWHLRQTRIRYIDENLPYKMVYFADYDFSELKVILSIYRSGAGEHKSYNDCIIMADTESSKKVSPEDEPTSNHVVAWSIAIRVYHRNLVCIWGIKPSDMAKTFRNIIDNLEGQNTCVYFHNLPWDWVYLRKFIFKEFGVPCKQLNVKPLYPIYIEFSCGLILRDSLILSQCSLEKWAENMDVEHKKAVGKWDYDKIRDQLTVHYTEDELLYIANDVLAGVECIDKLMTKLHKKIYSIPWTATGIVRDDLRKIGKQFKAHDHFKKCLLSWSLQQIFELVFHGGFCHGDRHFYNMVITSSMFGGLTIDGYDFASSYGAQLCMQKFPCESFHQTDDCRMRDILECSDTHCYVFLLTLYKVELVSKAIPMPALQQSKCIRCANPVVDNGRIIQADFVQIWLTNIDLQVIASMYTAVHDMCTQVYTARIDYLPRWQTDYTYNRFVDKTQLKPIEGQPFDKANYTIAKSKVATIYGLHVQKPCKEDIVEEYEYNEDMPLYHIDDESLDREQKYIAYGKNRNHILNYQIGVFVTAYAFRALFELGSCIDYQGKTLPDGIKGQWFYSDTDSCYGVGWDKEKVAAFNQRVKDKLTERGYGAVMHGGREYWLGIAEHNPKEDEYTEFKYVGAKRYCGRGAYDGELHLTVAGVPKKGVACLNNNINNFTDGFIFDGKVTGKKMHKHFIVPEIFIDERGNETGDSIDLSPCDYKLSSQYDPDWDPFMEEVNMQTYEEI